MILAARPINERLIFRLACEPSDEQIRAGVRRWLELLAVGHYATAAEAVSFDCRRPAAWLREQIEGFFGDRQRSTPIRPDEHTLAGVEVWRDDVPPFCKAVVSFRVPLANGLGVGIAFQIVSHDDGAIFSFGAFHR